MVVPTPPVPPVLPYVSLQSCTTCGGGVDILPEEKGSFIPYEGWQPALCVITQRGRKIVVIPHKWDCQHLEGAMIQSAGKDGA